MTATPIRREGHIVITGGAGFLGTNLAHALTERGEDVVIFDNLSRLHVRENVGWLRQACGKRLSLRVGDVRDAQAVADVVRGARAVVHLAAQVAVTTSVDDPITDFDVNARGTLNVLEAVRRQSPEAPLLFASTNKVYGKLISLDALEQQGSRYAPNDGCKLRGFDERTPLSLYSPYGCSKGSADQYVIDYAHIYGLKTAVFRMSCLYGPHQFGNEDQGWVAHFLISAMRGEPIAIYGDGNQVRDVLYADDAVSAYLLALDNAEAASGSVFNLGGGPKNTMSLRELLNYIARMEGFAPLVSFHDWRPGDQPWYVSNTHAIETALGWRALTDIKSGLEKLRQWLSQSSVLQERQHEAVA
ncbi:MAG: NAD-dependent epimerase/dehydratase family protein [Alphaproteobacteria bacterium]|nr:NAD-dependent epimerase/dehydratase family protein [Alphaproteobacteria bacterium]MBV9063869.1 NAD-dependent epimerase/dehydratase family protein [Alphaproteobacteria bacterium]